jgi:hypothetical protein
MAITQERTDDSPRKEAAPRQTASILSCKISSASARSPADQQDLREHDPAVLAVERGHRALIPGTDPAQRLSGVPAW